MSCYPAELIAVSIEQFKIQLNELYLRPNPLAPESNHQIMKLKKIIPVSIKDYVKSFISQEETKEEPLPKISYSQYAEDLILNSYFNKEKGFYIDIGAHDPVRFSNTYLFYKKGWRGINIDANPDSMIRFRESRVRDINLEIGISNDSIVLTFYRFKEPAINTFNKELAMVYESRGEELLGTLNAKTERLETVLDLYLNAEIEIDFMSVDTESLDLDVLKSNCWNKYSPKVVVVEYWSNTIDDLLNSDIYTFLVSNNYTLFSITICSVFFKRNY
jgi:hypothetical protein